MCIPDNSLLEEYKIILEGKIFLNQINFMDVSGVGARHNHVHSGESGRITFYQLGIL